MKKVELREGLKDLRQVGEDRTAPTRWTRLGWTVGAAFLFACGAMPPEFAPTNSIFNEIATQIGLDFDQFNGMSGEFYFVELLGGGAALFDYDGDGDLDLYLVQGHMLGEGKTVSDYLLESRYDPPFRDRLFRNELEATGELRFADVTAESGIDAMGYGMGVAVGDYTNNGCIDLYVLNWGPNQLWSNRCDGTFNEVSMVAGIADGRWSVAATFLDYDRDGWLDLYVVNYKSYSLTRDPQCRNEQKQREYCGPTLFESVPDRLYRNRGDGTFEDVSDASLIGSNAGAGLGVVARDLDGDGWLDLYVTNDQEVNYLWRNRTDGTFQDVATLTGTAVDAHGLPLASMGVDAADFDGDGFADLFMTHLNGEPNVLYRNLGNGLFEDVSRQAGLARPSLDFTGFGTLFFDYDNDGMLDLFVANGAIETLPKLRRRGDPFPVHQPNQLFRNLGSGKFAEVSVEAGSALTLSEVSRGAAFGDIDNDGDTDIVVANNAGPVRVLENLAGSRRPWLGLELVTGNPARAAHGARLRVDRRGAEPLWRQVRIDGSFASANDPRVLVGLGGASEVEGVRVAWTDGTSELFEALPLRQYSLLQYGTGRPVGDISK